MIPLLEPLFPGELAVHGEKLHCADTVPPDAVRVAELLRAPALLAEVLERHAHARGAHGADRRAVASAWSLEYIAMLLPPVMAAASMLQHVFPIAAEHTWVRFDARGAPAGFHLRQLGQPRPGSGTAERYAPLLWLHLAPLFEALTGLTRLAPKILWSNTARLMEPVFDVALAATGGASAIADDRARLLHAPVWPGAQGPRENPLQDRRGHRALKLHRECCLNHLLPHEHWCDACPLAPAQGARTAE
ncbi:ferric iron reductase protein FhuF [Variovorax sp. TBS-050B]|uniref:siderophore-iron reductase FhuF n=1 Tax=Variovorax sp. TBS-050B TaxID=2940551 RepID=UPI002475DF71|nr:siderophore-iron reductase FhuF [Variovorax sp. TBS-050B]MDH6593504.1 ferric iron reductase protein FhuF [Variovorax sp. TBS-050B]